MDASLFIETYPLTPDRWRDFAELMSSRFDTRRCWCMWPRRPDSYKNYSADENRRAIKCVVDSATAPPGVLAYVNGAPVGWCAVAPRTEFAGLDRLKATAAVDDNPAVWSVVCFYVLRAVRGKGVSRRLLSAALELAQEHGAEVVEAYPVERSRNAFRGTTSLFGGAGFTEVARRAPNRPIVRFGCK